MRSQFQIDNEEKLKEINAVIDDHLNVLETMKRGRDIVTMPRDEYYRNYYAQEALRKIQQANEKLPLSTENLEALLSFPAIAYDWNVIMQHPSLLLMSDEQKQDLSETIAKLDVRRSAKIEKLNIEKDKLQTLADAMSPCSELKKIKRILSSISSDPIANVASIAPFQNRNDLAFEQACILIANQRDPKFALNKAIEHGQKMQLIWPYLDELINNKKDHAAFDRFMNRFHTSEQQGMKRGLGN